MQVLTLRRRLLRLRELLLDEVHGGRVRPFFGVQGGRDQEVVIVLIWKTLGCLGGLERVVQELAV